MFRIILISVLFFICSLLLVAILDIKKCFSKRSLFFFAMGFASFLCVFFVQMPLQKLLSSSRFFYNLGDLPRAILYAAIAGFVQEFFKAMAAYYPKGDMLSGAAAGSGFAFFEIIFVISSAPSITLVVLTERLFVLIFHTSSSALVMFGKNKGKFIIFYIIVACIHTFVDTLAILFRLHYITLLFTEIVVAVVSSVLFLIALFLYKRKTSAIFYRSK